MLSQQLLNIWQQYMVLDSNRYNGFHQHLLNLLIYKKCHRYRRPSAKKQASPTPHKHQKQKIEKTQKTKSNWKISQIFNKIQCKTKNTSQKAVFSILLLPFLNNFAPTIFKTNIMISTPETKYQVVIWHFLSTERLHVMYTPWSWFLFVVLNLAIDLGFENSSRKLYSK